jgi:glycosyltransferase involved in cell wall biosynthesis
MGNLPNTHSRPTISLAIIAKNEERNLPRLLESVKDCFDEIVVVDTGSTDKTREIAASSGCELYDFTWVDDFSKARNFAFSKATSDYVMWLDCDDALKNREAFIKWRDHAMAHADCWLATYHYAVDKDLNPIISFVRERVFKRTLEPKWQYALHEGVILKPEWSRQYATPWSVNHLRDEEDMKADRSRNIRLIEKMVQDGNIDGRMQFYYGKELYEIGRIHEAIPAFEKALTMPAEGHDRLLALQYGGYAAMAAFDQLRPELSQERQKYFDKALDFAHQGMRIDPNRAEFHVLVGDAYVRVGALAQSVPYFAAAKSCLKNFDSKYEGAIYSFRNLYGEAPSVQLAKVYAHIGLLDKAKKEAKECIEIYDSAEARQILNEVDRVTTLTSIKNNQTQTEDIVFTTPVQNAYEFDEELYKTRPMGGSETALIQMAKLLKEKTGRSVKVFNMREKDLVAESGVEYISNKKLSEYLSKNKPRIHVSWRHNIKLTDAETYLWCHDLFTPGCESVQNFDKMLCLTPFHKDYVQGLQGISDDKIIVTRNGIDPSKFIFEPKAKNPNKVVWLSSPDRGLDRCMLVMDKVQEKFPDIELHVYYGIEHLHKYGPQMAALATKLKGMMDERSYVKYHGNTEQKKMYRDVSDAVIWNHCNDFIETYCITALETLANGIYPIVRRLGALQDTLKEANENGSAQLLDYGWQDENAVDIQANAVMKALETKAWERMKPFDLNANSWSAVADSWVEMMNLKEVEVIQTA